MINTDTPFQSPNTLPIGNRDAPAEEMKIKFATLTSQRTIELKGNANTRYNESERVPVLTPFEKLLAHVGHKLPELPYPHVGPLNNSEGTRTLVLWLFQRPWRVFSGRDQSYLAHRKKGETNHSQAEVREFGAGSNGRMLHA
jgi:hypothetical protein